MAELKPCSHCGGHALAADCAGAINVTCQNPGCGIECVASTIEEAAAIWNHRADDPLKQRVCETLERIMPDECYAGEARVAADCDGCTLCDICDRYLALQALNEAQALAIQQLTTQLTQAQEDAERYRLRVNELLTQRDWEEWGKSIRLRHELAEVIGTSDWEEAVRRVKAWQEVASREEAHCD